MDLYKFVTWVLAGHDVHLFLTAVQSELDRYLNKTDGKHPPDGVEVHTQTVVGSRRSG